MTVLSRLIGGIAKLPPAETHDVMVERDLKVTMPDGVVLLAHHYAPRGVEKPPLLLVRCCYGRGGVFGLIYGTLFAERGFQVLIQSTRGTFGSGGTFTPFEEHDDGLATVTWLKQQPWYPGSFMMTGASYLGFVQWAIARDAGPDLKALAIQESASEFRNQTYTGGAFALDTGLSWIDLIARQEHTHPLAQLLSGRRLRPLFAHLPLRDLDKHATGKHAPFFQEWLAHNEPGDAYWETRRFDHTVSTVATPIHLMGGWYDIFLPWQLRDYHTLREAGQRPYLIIGPWAHVSPELGFLGIRETLPWLKAVVHDENERYRQMPVRVFVTGANEWRELADWPPPDAIQQRFHLQPFATLAPDVPPPSKPDQYRYDPTHPTPALAGPVLLGSAQPVDNRSLEARTDVLVYTSSPLVQDLDVIGPVQADLFVKSTLAHTDFFARLCDVDLQGKSINVCDALLRVRPEEPAPDPDGILHITIDLWPSAHRFRSGHCLRLQVSSGAHPRYARNPGSSEPLASATKLFAADQSIYHDPEHPSGVVLSVCGM